MNDRTLSLWSQVCKPKRKLAVGMELRLIKQGKGFSKDILIEVRGLPILSTTGMHKKSGGKGSRMPKPQRLSKVAGRELYVVIGRDGMHA